MFKSIILILSLMFFPVAHAEPQWALGAAMESRFQREVNPDYGGVQNVGAFFTKLRLAPWAMVLEVGHEDRHSSSGSLSIHTQSTNGSLWARYEFLGEQTWRPFLGAGLGLSWDRVDTSFANSTDTRTGQRGLFGFGGGVSGLLWKYLLAEVELRVVSIEDVKDPVLSGLLRLGLQL